MQEMNRQCKYQQGHWCTHRHKKQQEQLLQQQRSRSEDLDTAERAKTHDQLYAHQIKPLRSMLCMQHLLAQYRAPPAAVMLPTVHMGGIRCASC